MTRISNWPERLSAFLDQVQHTPFSYGPDGQDCVRLAAGAIEAVTGVDVLEGLPSWKDEATARAVIKDLGPSLPEAVDAVLTPHGVKRIDPRLAGRGDIVLLPSGALGVHTGRNIVARSGKEFIWYPPTGVALIAWRI